MRAVLVPHSAIPDEQKGHVEGDPDAVVERLADLLAVVDALGADADLRVPRRVSPDVAAARAWPRRFAGWVDAVSGGGGLVQLPALLIVLPGGRAGAGARHQQAVVGLRHRGGGADLPRRVRPDLRTALPMAGVALVGRGGGALCASLLPQRGVPARSCWCCSSRVGGLPCAGPGSA